MVYGIVFRKGKTTMRKTKLLLGALSIAAIMPLASCGLERTDANDFQGTCEMYKAFFEKTYEYDNMKVVMDLGDGRFRTEYICASTSHSIDSNDNLHTWAFFNRDGWKTVAYEYDFESQTGKTHWFKYDSKEYGTEYKSFISYIDVLGSVEANFIHYPELEDQAVFEAKKENLGDEKTRLKFTIGARTIENNTKNWLTYVAEAEHGLVTRVSYSTIDMDEGVVDRSTVITFSYGGIKSIEVPDITGWPER